MTESLSPPTGAAVSGSLAGATIPPDREVVIAVDAMGGDYAPAEIVRGAAIYLHQFGTEQNSVVVLTGDEERIGAELRHIRESGQAHAAYALERLRVVPTSQIIGMDEHPMEAFREKPDSSLLKCIHLVHAGQADGAFSAGNTGAFMVAATQILERITGVKRPAIATLFPNETGGRAVVVDAGANVDCRPSQLLQFALLGSIYAEHVLGVVNPRIGLLSNGEEDAKGSELVHGARTLLENARPALNFVGNVEGNHVFEGGVDVVICDGFVGNVLLKGAEGVVRLVLSLLAADAKNAPDETTREALLASLLRLRQRVDYSEFGGAPLLGVNGPVFIAHGRSDSRAIATGIQIAAQASRSGYVASIRQALGGAAA